MKQQQAAAYRSRIRSTTMCKIHIYKLYSTTSKTEDTRNYKTPHTTPRTRGLRIPRHRERSVPAGTEHLLPSLSNPVYCSTIVLLVELKGGAVCIVCSARQFRVPGNCW